MQQLSFIVVPYLLRRPAGLSDVCRHYDTLSRLLDRTCQTIIIVNDPTPSQRLSFQYEFLSDNITLLELPEDRKGGGNQKLDAIFYVFDYVKRLTDQPFNLLLYDDDARPTREVVTSTIASLAAASYSYRICLFERSDIYNLVDLAGFYTHNSISSVPQIWANLAISNIYELGHDVSSDSLYDERYLIEKFAPTRNLPYAFLESPALLVDGKRTLKTFLAQRLRYCYENIGSIGRFGLDLAVVPALLTIGFLFSLAAAIGVVAALALLLTLCAAAYWARLPQASRGPFFTPALAILWYLPYPLLAWPALAMRFTIGIRFGVNRIRRP